MSACWMYLCRGFLNSCCSLDVKVGFFGQLREFLGFRSTGLVSLISWRAQYKSSKCLPTRQQPSSKIRFLIDHHPTKTNNIKFRHLERSVQHRRKCWSCMLRSSRVQEAERHTFDTILLIPVEARGDPLAGRPNYMFWTPARYSEFL
jgi:hypothetical protein